MQLTKIKKIYVYLEDRDEIACKPYKLINTHNKLIIIKGN